MARISEFEQSGRDSIEISLTAEEWARYTILNQTYKIALFTIDGKFVASSDGPRLKNDFKRDPDTGEYVYVFKDKFSNHGQAYQAIVFGSVDKDGNVTIYNAYMIGWHNAKFDFSKAADIVTETSNRYNWVPYGTKFTDISQENAVNPAGGNNQATLRWDSPHNVDNPTVRFDSDLGSSGSAPPPPPPCFVKGALIETPHGAVEIETLKVGDTVQTRDSGFQPLRWIGYSRIYKHAMITNPCRYPIRLRAGSLGENIPARACYFSRQHRVLVGTMDDSDGVLVPIKDLIGQPGIELANDWQGHADYFHMFFDKHEIVFSDGMQSESLLLTEYSLSLIGAAEKTEIQKIAENGIEMEPARPILEGKAAREHLENVTSSGFKLQDQLLLEGSYA